MDIMTRPPCYELTSGKLYLSANQLNLVSGALTLVELNHTSSGFTDGIEDTTNHKITPGRAGFYDVKAQITLNSIVADTRYIMIIKLNGTTDKVTTYVHAAITERISMVSSAHLYLSATDYLELLVMSVAGVNTVDIIGGERYTFLSVQKVR